MRFDGIQLFIVLYPSYIVCLIVLNMFEMKKKTDSTSIWPDRDELSIDLKRIPLPRSLSFRTTSIVIYHSVDMNGVISLVNSQKGHFRIIQDFLKVSCDTKSRIIQLLYILTFFFTSVSNVINCTACSLY